jgi:hypothetical protein
LPRPVRSAFRVWVYPLSGFLLPTPLNHFSGPSVPGILSFRVLLPQTSHPSLEVRCSLTLYPRLCCRSENGTSSDGWVSEPFSRLRAVFASTVVTRHPGTLTLLELPTSEVFLTRQAPFGWLLFHAFFCCTRQQSGVLESFFRVNWPRHSRAQLTPLVFLASSIFQFVWNPTRRWLIFFTERGFDPLLESGPLSLRRSPKDPD